MGIRSVAMAFALAWLAATPAAALSVDEAYVALNHRRTVFDERASKASKAQAENLKRLFTIAERGTVLKVRAYDAHARGDTAAYNAVLAEYVSLIDWSKAQGATAEIKPAQDLVVTAVIEQRAVLAAALGKPPGTLARSALAQKQDVRKVHGDLIHAYMLLKKAFPREPAVNYDAFYDYLCALDFL